MANESILNSRCELSNSSYAEMAAKNKSSGYDFYSGHPYSTVTTQQKKWRKKLEKLKAVRHGASEP